MSMHFSESLKLQRNPEQYAFLKLGGSGHIESHDDKQNFAITKVRKKFRGRTKINENLVIHEAYKKCYFGSHPLKN